MWSDLLPVAFDLQFLVMEVDSISVCEAECEVRGMRISSPKSEAMTLSWKMEMAEEKLLPKMEEFKYSCGKESFYSFGSSQMLQIKNALE